jgi:hypothetical protein
MGESIETTPRSVLDFNKNLNYLMKHLCSHLHKFGIVDFTYIRAYKDGKRLYLASNLEWLQIYIRNNFQDDWEHIECNAPNHQMKRALWSGFKRDKVFDALYDLNLWNGIYIYESYLDYTDSFSFFSQKEHNQIQNFYLNQYPILEEFIRIFKDKAFDLVHPVTPEKLLIPSKPFFRNRKNVISLTNPEKIKSFMKQIGVLHRAKDPLSFQQGELKALHGD